MNRRIASPLALALVLSLAQGAGTACGQRIDLVPGPLLNPAPAPNPAPAALRPLTERDVLRLIAQDLDTIEAEDRPLMRYLSVVPVWNAVHHAKDMLAEELRAHPRTNEVSIGCEFLPLSLSGVTSVTLEEKVAAAVREGVEKDQDALSMLINSLSWAPDISRVQIVEGSARQVFRLRLSKYHHWDGRPWNAADWQRILDEYPYGVRYNSDPLARKIAEATGCPIPYVRGDWFIHAAARPPLYHDLLGLPATTRALERRLGVDVAANIAAGTVVIRSAANSPKYMAVSLHNRLIERHPLPPRDGAYYWKSYDFADNSPAREKDLFSAPLGPATSPKSTNLFRNDGTEILFSLPNGLQGYMIANSRGDRLDQAPIEIVHDFIATSGRVTNGVSCIRCHGAGLNPVLWDAQKKQPLFIVENQVLAHVEKNAASFSAEEFQQIRRLYKDDRTVREQMAKDVKQFRAALAVVAPKLAPDATPRYQGELLSPAFVADLGLSRAAAELGLNPHEFQNTLRKSPGLARRLGLLALKEQLVEDIIVDSSLALPGPVKRQVFEETFPEMVREWGYAGYPPKEVAPTWKEPQPEPRSDEPGVQPSSFWTWGTVFGGATGAGLVLLAFLGGMVVGRMHPPGRSGP
jgi:hypothetical protein